jgi:L-ascorbate metabolism protein UlaG (beta-lactamase superfamily)
MKITMIGHSTLLIEIEGQRVLTDPYFGTWGNPAYARVAPLAKKREELCDVDAVLISHHHFDHMDRSFLRMLAASAPLRNGVPVAAPYWMQWLTPLVCGARHVIGMKPWQEVKLGPLVVTAVPAVHIDVTIGFVMCGEGKQVYFAGDTYYYGSFMKQIGQRFRLDAALMPVTTYRIPMTMGEKDAVRAVRDLRPSVVIPIHEGLRPRSPLMRTDQTPQAFAQRLREAGLESRVVILKEGDELEL